MQLKTIWINLNGVLKFAKEVTICELCYYELVVCLHVFNPLVSLPLEHPKQINTL